MAGVWAVGPGAMVVSELSALIGVFSGYAFHGRVGEQSVCVCGPAVCHGWVWVAALCFSVGTHLWTLVPVACPF